VCFGITALVLWGVGTALKQAVLRGSSSSGSVNASRGAGAASGNEHSSAAAAAAAAAASDAGEVLSLEDLSSKVAQVHQR
jgi:hypothetical protein